MVRDGSRSTCIVGSHIKELRVELDWSQKKIGLAISIGEGSRRARISRYERIVHESPLRTAGLIAYSIRAPLAYLCCDDDKIAAPLWEWCKKHSAEVSTGMPQ